MSRLAFVWIFLGIVCGGAGAAEPANIFFKTSPRIELLRPFADPIDLSLLITGSDGKPVQAGEVAIRLEAPRPGRFFSTDYPLVEGSLLNEMRLPLRQGRAAWKYLFPVRGEYGLVVEYMSEEGTNASNRFTFRVRENRQKIWALTGFSLALVVLGFVAGRVFTGAAAGSMLLGGAVLLLAAQVGSHVPGTSGPPSAELEIEPATVGKPSLVRWRSTGEPAGMNSNLSLSILHLEKQKVVFAMDRISVADEWSMKFHFPDGAEYRVVSVGETPGRPRVRSEQVIVVRGAEPPAAASVPALAYFTGLIAVGLGAGRWSKRLRDSTA